MSGADDLAYVARFALGGAGTSVAIKDSIDIAGMVTGGGSRALADSSPADEHAAVVRLLLDAGWQINGKTNMHELAYGMTGINAYTGTPRNPQDPSRIPGGSSSGSAVAVGSGAATVAIGSDTGGSIRVPAACCGVIGLKPTFGRVSRAGVWPRVSSLDCVGPFAASMRDLIAAMAVIAPGFDAAAARQDRKNARLRLVSTDSDGVILGAIDQALATSGWNVERIKLDGMQQAFEAGLVIINRETSDAFGHLTGRGLLGADIEQRLAMAANTTDAALAAAEAVRASFSAAIDRALDGADALVLPTLPQLPPTLDDIAAGASVIAMSSLVRPFNLSGHPALTIPVAVPGSTLKAGLQLVGRKGDDETLCALALHLALHLARSSGLDAQP